MTEQNVAALEIGPLLKRNALVAILAIALGTLLGYAAILYVPPKYKAKCVLNIQAAYFQNALLGNILYQSYDPAEQNAQRVSLLRMALSEEYLEKLGRKFSLFVYSANDPRHGAERAGLLKRIEYFSVNSSAFQIGTVARDAYVAYAMLEDVLEQMITTLIDERRRTLVTMRDAIQTRVQELIPGISTLVPASNLETDNLKAELLRIQEQVAVLKSQFTERHPEVLRLEERERLLEGMLRDLGVAPGAQSTPDSGSANRASKGAQQEVLDDLIKKLNNLSVVLDMEQNRENIRFLTVVERPTLPVAPFFPPHEVFLLLGIAGGMVLAAVLVTYRELSRGTFLAPEVVAGSLGVPLLGELPELEGRKQLQLPQAPGVNAIRRQLPAPTQGG
jgi:uncharacterized protein involved in exopolysaccharide biosynthesis